ncbi:hypothetical protein Tco_1523308 [Tanacetum coccineum]
MPPKRTSTSETSAITLAAIQQLINDGISSALKAQAASMASDSNPNSELRKTSVERNCAYEKFTSYQLSYFNGTDEAVGLIRWFKQTESIFSHSKCAKEDKVRFAVSTLTKEALSWWIQSIGIEEAYKITWSELKRLLIEKYCSQTEIKKMEEVITMTQKLIKHVMKHNSIQETNNHKRKMIMKEKPPTTTLPDYHNKTLPQQQSSSASKWKAGNLQIVQILQHLQAARDGQRSYANVRRKPLEFQVDDRVMLKVSPQLPKKLSSIYNTFHISNLKKYLSDESLIIPIKELQLDDKLNFVEEPVEIIDREIKQLKRSRIPIVKVRWNSKRGPEFTWEREDEIRAKYPHLFSIITSSSIKSRDEISDLMILFYRRLQLIRPSGVIIEDWVSDDEEDIFQSEDSQTTVKPSFKKIEFTKARNETVKTDKQAVKPRMVTQSPKVDRKDWNEKMTQKPGLGFGFTKKACFVCGSHSHLIKDCDFHEKRISKEFVLRKGTGHKEVRQIWNNTQRINHQNKFVPTAVLTRSERIPVSTAKQVNGVNTVGQRAFSIVKGNGVTAVKASAGCVWRLKTGYIQWLKDNSGSWISKRVNYIDPQGRLKSIVAWVPKRN